MKCFLFGCLAIALLSACTTNSPAPDDTWSLVWEDDFEGDTINAEYWSKIPRGTADWNNYMSDYDPLYAVRDGNLVLRGIVTAAEANDTAPFITGGVYTNGKKAFRNGRLEIKAKLNPAKGAWPAIWLMPFAADAPKWPNGGEIDIMERLNGDSIAYQTVHSHYTYVQGIRDNPKSGITAPIDPDGFNVYAVELYPDSLRFFINDSLTNTYPRIETDKPGQFPFDREWHLKIDMQLGGAWVGEVDPADLPVEMEVDWVRFYKKEN